ncbi:MAG TPA: PVC-type heme-binding CxxCH protein [Planctomycetaceae bacterium]|nr:PVC-type heme-binding CxxCH protein [Planctomycetaceae bacterium]
MLRYLARITMHFPHRSQSPSNRQRRTSPLASGAALVLSLVCAVHAADHPAPGLQVPDGFEVTQYAGDDLAHDIYSMTIDPRGRVVVSGAGYIRILVDADGDGRADSFKQFADGPRTGAQGLCFEGHKLLCTGDAGLIVYTDADADDRADGPPEVLLRLKTGGEHHAHAIRRGPDGWWYVIAGNDTGITSEHVTRPASSPVRNPRAGTLLCLTPDFKQCEVVCDGFRNAYDFDFNALGELFVYDSDGERDVSLPWYRPTRVFHALPGSNAGWVSRSWKWPDDFLGMPPVIAALGRGSPTGVACYRHTQFPATYRGAVFVLDWTFGRVMALPLEQDGSTWKSTPVEFMTAVGQFGFAPTDLAVGPDGSLYVSVGGRGTQGGVFRVTWTGAAAAESPAAAAGPGSAAERLALCLDAPQPLASWSRAAWVPLASALGREPFVQAALDNVRDPAARVRAVEIVTELFGGFDDSTLLRLATARPVEVRARAAWSWGRTEQSRGSLRPILLFLADRQPLVVRSALEALDGAAGELRDRPLLVALANSLASNDRFVRQAAARVAGRLPQEWYDQLAELVYTRGEQAVLTQAFAAVRTSAAFDAHALEIGLRALEGDGPREVKLEAARLVQLALGDLGSNGRLPPVFDGYATPLDLAGHTETTQPAARRLSAAFPTGDGRLDAEVARALAMLGPSDAGLLDRLLDRITDESHPVDDIHYLVVASRVAGERSDSQRERIARGLVALEPKIVARRLNQDLHWETRVGEMYAQHVKLAPKLPETIVAQPAFGTPGHVYFLTELPAEHVPRAIAAFVQRVTAGDDDTWTPGVVFLLGESSDAAHRELLRGQFENFAVRDAVLLVLAEQPEAAERPLFVAGLESPSLAVLSACVKALAALPAGDDADDLFALLRLFRRLGSDKSEYPLREQVLRLIARSSGQDFGFVFGDEGHRPQPQVAARGMDWLAQRYPAAAARELAGDVSERAELQALLAEVDWAAGDAHHGRTLFETRSCARCHGGRQALGPDLAGVTTRFSRDDLLTAIVVPDRDVSPRYQQTLVQTTRGQVYTGLIVYEAVDGLLLRDATGRTFRIEAGDIELQRRLSTSLMPTGLLKGLKPQELADLVAYLESLSPPRMAEK